MNQHLFYYQSTSELKDALAKRKISATELLQETISRIEQYDKSINAVVVRDYEHALNHAKWADEKLAHGEHLPLLGLPMTVKESIHVKGLPASWGNPIYKNWLPQQDAVAIERLKKAGANIIGKSNVPFMLRDWQTFNDIYGTTNNPYNLAYTPGGSSGGSAAALAAGFVPIELGSDLAGSLRTPASFCGVMTHKPSLDVIPTRGANPPTTDVAATRVDLAVIGPMARSVDDLLLVFDVINGPDPLGDGKAYQLTLPPPRQQTLRDYRVLVIYDHPLCPTATVINDALASVVNELSHQGVKITQHTKEHLDLAATTCNYATIYSAALAELPDKEYADIKAKAECLAAQDDSISARILRAKICSHREWLIHMRERLRLRQRWDELFNDYDVIICPVMPTVAFKHNEQPIATRQIEINGQLFPYINQLCWISLATLFNSPATVVPVSQTPEGLPIGIQVIGNYLEDYTTLHFARLLEQFFGGFVAPPAWKKSQN